MKEFDKIYIAKYKHMLTIRQLAEDLKESQEQINKTIIELQEKGLDEIYLHIPDSEWENLEHKTDEYILKKYLHLSKKNNEKVIRELIDVFRIEKHNFEVFDSFKDEIKRRKDMIITNEEWKPLKDFNYSVSNYGRVKNNTTGKFKELRVGRFGFQINLWDRSKSKMFTMSRLVANYFIREVQANEKVRHIDGDIRNNYYKNLKKISK